MKTLFALPVALATLIVAMPAMACTTPEEAGAKMTEITQSAEYKEMMMNAGTADGAEKVTAINTKIGEASSLSGEHKFPEACTKMQEIKDELKIQ